MASTVLVGYPPQRRQNSNAITGSGRTGSLLITRSSHRHPFPQAARSAPAKNLLALPVRGGDDEAVEFRRDLDLTTKPRVGLNLISKIQHIFFLVRRLAGESHPFLADIDMARRAGAAAAAFGGDLGDRVADGVFHDRGAFLCLDGPGFAKGVDIRDFDHGSCMFVRVANEGFFREGKAQVYIYGWFYNQVPAR
jgi:hypothetical protein